MGHGQFCVALTDLLLNYKVPLAFSFTEMILLYALPRFICTIKYAVSHACSAFSKVVMHYIVSYLPTIFATESTVSS